MSLENGSKERIDERSTSHAGAGRSQAEGGRPAAQRGVELPEVLKQLEISEATYHRWREQYGGMKADDVKRLKELEAENAQAEADRRRSGCWISRGSRSCRGETSEPGASTSCRPGVAGAAGVVERRACRLAGQHRSTQRHSRWWLAMMRRCERSCGGSRGERPRWGYRRAHRLLLEDGWELNRKRTQRLWREEGLRVPRSGASVSGSASPRCRPTGCGLSGQITCGRSISSGIRPLTGRTSSCCTSWTSSPARRWRSSASAASTPIKTVDVLDRLVGERGTAAGVHALRQRARDDRERDRGTGAGSVAPGARTSSPARRGRTPTSRASAAASATSCSRRAVLLPGRGRVLIEDWRDDYNHHRPHSALEMMTPAAFAASLRQPLPAAHSNCSWGRGRAALVSYPWPAATHSQLHAQPGNDRILLRRSPPRRRTTNRHSSYRHTPITPTQLSQQVDR